MKNCLILIIASILFCGSVLAQKTAPKPAPKIINGGIINGKALSLPKPDYPTAALTVKAAGIVQVQVLIDEQGNVIAASAISGHPLLRQTAATAAHNAKFSPTMLSGVPVKVSGIINYNFAVEKSNEEKLKICELSIAIYLLKYSADDLGKFAQDVDSENPVQELVDEFTEFTAELAPLVKLQTTPKENRNELFDKVNNSLNARFSDADRWQFELGKNFGELVAPVFSAKSRDSEQIDFSKFDPALIKTNLAKINDLTLSAPPDFPADVLEKLKDLASIDQKSDFSDPKILKYVFYKFVNVAETISPDKEK